MGTHDKAEVGRGIHRIVASMPGNHPNMGMSDDFSRLFKSKVNLCASMHACMHDAHPQYGGSRGESMPTLVC